MSTLLQQAVESEVKLATTSEGGCHFFQIERARSFLDISVWCYKKMKRRGLDIPATSLFFPLVLRRFSALRMW